MDNMTNCILEEENPQDIRG